MLLSVKHWKAQESYCDTFEASSTDRSSTSMGTQRQITSGCHWLGLVENDPHPAVKMTDLKRDLQVARAECEATLSPEQYTAAWEVGKTLDVETVVTEILCELQAS